MRSISCIVHPMTDPNSAAAFLVLAAPVAFAAVALLATAHPGRRPAKVIAAGFVAGSFGIAVAIAGGIAVAIDGAISSPTLGVDGMGVAVRLDPLSATMSAMIAVLALVIFKYSTTYLDGDDRHGVFLGQLAATVAAVEVLVLSGNLALFFVAWIATSLALHRLLTFYRDRPRAVLAARKKFVVARIGDVFLLAAVVLLYHHFGTGDLDQIFSGVASTASTEWSVGAVSLAALCLAVAAVLKSAQFPTHGWLVEVMETPTPVSALLHAGILNAGPFLAIRMAYVLDTSRAATTFLLVVGGFTAAFASVVLLTQSSVKVSLGYSSAAHMGFMLMVCGMGFYPAALLHLVAHSFYKAHAFLSSGSVIDEARARGVRLPRRLGSPIRIAGSALIALAWYLPLAFVWGTDFGGNPVELAVGGILVMGTTQLIAPAVDSDGSAAGALRASLLALAVTVSFFTLEAAAHSMLEHTVPESVSRDAIQLTVIALIIAGFACVVLLQVFEPTRPRTARQRAFAVHLRNGFYANAAFDRFVGALRSPAREPQPSVDRPMVQPPALERI
jgi:NAD(P)H-quinone oxidoreductase subunit 5